MVSGSDSHGAPVVFKAEEKGILPAQMAEESHKKIVETFEKFGFIYENYTKTTNPIHKEVAQNIFRVLYEKGYLNIQKSKQYFDPKVERFLPDRYVRGTCPKCGAKNARGDECPECGAYLEPEQLIDPYSTLSDAKPQLRETEHFYMDLTALQKQLGEWLSKDKSHWRKWVREFSLGWIKQGLEARPVTRDMNFGIPVPIDGWEHKVIYVWIEAVVGYLSAAIEWADKIGEPSVWENFWKNPDCRHYYFIAGGNTPFHTIMWPGEIIAYNEKYQDKELWEKYKLPGEIMKSELNLPYDVPANNMLFYEGKKMSKGDGTGVTVDEVYEKFGPDAIRYYFVRNAPENQDKSWNLESFIETNNSELVGNLGNFINRALSFAFSKFDGKVPAGTLQQEVKVAIDKALIEYGKHIERCQFVKASEDLLKLGDFANKYFNDSEVWQVVKSDEARAGEIIYNTIQLANAIRIMLKPITPFAIEKLNRTLDLEEQDPTNQVEKQRRSNNKENLLLFNEINAGTEIEKPEPLFRKFE